MTEHDRDGSDGADGGSDLSSIQPLEHLDNRLMRILDQVREHTGAARASLFLRDPETGGAVTQVAHLDEVERIRVAPGEGIVGQVLSSGRTCAWPGEGPEPDAASIAATGYRPRAILAVPVLVDDAPVGVLEVIDGDLCEALSGKGGRARRRTERMAMRVARVLEGSSLVAQLRPRGERTAALHYAYEGIIGASPAMKRAFALAARVAGTGASVLVTGETGTGKELFARALHANSTRREGPLVKVDCGAIPDTLIENELFGHEAGAFTGAAGKAKGRFEEADGGSLFLDEVGELSTMAQTRLLRVLEDRVVQRLGGGKPTDVDFRLISATHRDLVAMAHAGDFRMDLLQRLKVVRIRLPSLRERGAADIIRLIEHFTELHGRRHNRPVKAIPAATQEALVAYSWPGNVRELSHAVESAVVLTADGVLHLELFELDPPPPRPEEGSSDHPFRGEPTVAELEQRYLEWLMDRYQGRRTDVARVSGLGRTTLWRRLKDMGYE